MFTIKSIDYGLYTIKVWEQRPTAGHDPINNSQEEDFGLGSHGYEIFNPKGISISYDDKGMWDEKTCILNAITEIKVDLDKTNKK